MYSPPSPRCSALLRNVIKAKRRSGQLAEALALGRMGAALAAAAAGSEVLDSLSRAAFVAYLELHPDDTEVAQALASIDYAEAPVSVADVDAPAPGPEGDSKKSFGGLPIDDPVKSRQAVTTAISNALPSRPYAAGEDRRSRTGAWLAALALTVAGAGLYIGPSPVHVAAQGAPGERWGVVPTQSLAVATVSLTPADNAVVPSAPEAGPGTGLNRQMSPPGETVGAVSGQGDSAAAAPQQPETAKEKPREAFVIRAVGDIVLGNDYRVARLPDPANLSRIEALRSHLLDADLVVGNLEQVLAVGLKSRKDLSQPGRYAFRAPPAYAAVLRTMGFGVLNLANNHALDFGAEGLASTVRALQAEGLQPVGVAGAESPLIELRGHRIAFLSFSYLLPFAHLDDHDLVHAAVARARSQADLVIVSVHAGQEGERAAGLPSGPEYFRDEYRGDLRRFAHAAIEAGAALVLGHGPHVVRPVEIYRGAPIFYSLGNFVGYRSFSRRGKLSNSMVAEVRFAADGRVSGIGVIPLRFDNLGIPVADYSAETIGSLGELFDREIAKPPVLDVSITLGEDSVGRGKS